MTKKQFQTLGKDGKRKPAAYNAKMSLAPERVDAAVDRAIAPEVARSGDRKAVKQQFADDDGYAAEVTGRVHSDLLLSSAYQAASIQVHTVSTAGADVDLEWRIQALERAAERLKTGDMSAAEEMLLHQAAALGSLFTFLTLRATGNIGHSMDTVETYMKMGLRCQSQARATLETIAAIKNPPVVYARQANFANGPQQVNNGVPPPSAHAAESKVERNELSKSKVTREEGQRLDFGSLQGSGRTLEGVAALGEVDRTSDGGRKSEVVP